MSIHRLVEKSHLIRFLDSIMLVGSYPRTNVYSSGDNTYVIVTKDLSKFLYYSYALAHKYRHIPKIYNMIYDYQNNLCLIEREKLEPIIEVKQIAELDKMRVMLTDRKSYNRLTEEMLNFYYDCATDYNINFDFGPHWLMWNQKRTKLVVSDGFDSNWNSVYPKYNVMRKR